MNWPIVQLGALCNTVTKGTTPTSVGLSFSETGIPFIRIQDIDHNTVSVSSCLYIDEHTHNALERSKIRGGDLLITIAGTIGKVAIVPNGFPESNCNQAIAILRFDKKKLHPHFLRYWLATDKAVSQIGSKKVTATISNLSLGQIKQLQIPLPPLEEQKRIAAILEKADAIRQKRQQAIALADDFLRSVFLDMFGDPVTNPKGWERVKLGDLISSGPTNGLYKPSSAYGSGTRILRIDGFYDGVLSEQKYFKRVEISKEEVSRFSLIERGIVINRVNSPEYLGKCAFIDKLHESTIFESNMMFFTVDEELLNPVFLTQQLQMPNIKQQTTNNKQQIKNKK
jgi:type I restriction enzyme S subunit